MYAFHRVFKKSRQTVGRGGLLLGLLLVLQAAHFPLLGQQFGSNVQYFSQVVVNAGSTTFFTIHNPSDTNTITVDAQLYFPDGQPLADGQVELGPGATESLSFGDTEANLTRAWAELKSDDEFIATEFFQLSISGQLKPLVGVLPSPVSKEIRLAGFVNPQFKSGLAVSNPSSTEATEITVRVKDNTGQQPVNEKKVTLAPLECIAGFLNEALFFGAELSNFEGVVEISVNSPPVAALSLIQDAASGDVATVAVLTAIPNIITDTDNTALGVDALSSNTTGIFNTATGASALTSNTEGSSNTAIGGSAFFSNTTGFANTAIGDDALMSNTEGERNTATGGGALFENTTGSLNTAIGVVALASNTTGDRNTALGDDALSENTTGSNNTAIGYRAGELHETGDNNIYIGNDGSTASESNTIRIGNVGHVLAEIAGVQVVPVSSRRFKEDIHDMAEASGALMQMRPVTFRYRREYDTGERRLRYGLIAEEVAEVYPELVVNDEMGKARTVLYQELSVMLLNELQKQHAQIQSLTKRLTSLEEDPTAKPTHLHPGR